MTSRHHVKNQNEVGGMTEDSEIRQLFEQEGEYAAGGVHDKTSQELLLELFQRLPETDREELRKKLIEKKV